MSLFVGNVSKHVSLREIENLFKKYGKCRIDLRDRYAFVQFDNDSHGEAAKKQLQHQTFHGRFGENNKRKNGGNERKRSRSRENRWRRQDHWGRRSPSNDRRSPSYSENTTTDLETFVPVCPRDQIILKKLKAKAKEHEKHKDSYRKEAQGAKNISSSSFIKNHEQNDMNSKNCMEEENVKNAAESSKIVEQEEGVIHEDGQIPTPK